MTYERITEIQRAYPLTIETTGGPAVSGVYDPEAYVDFDAMPADVRSEYDRLKAEAHAKFVAEENRRDREYRDQLATLTSAELIEEAEGYTEQGLSQAVTDELQRRMS
jgi:hypothetical protein